MLSIFILLHSVLLFTLLLLQKVRALVEKLEEEAVPGQGAKYAEGCLTVRGIPTKSKGPLSLQVSQDKREVLDLGDGGGAGEGELWD